MVINHNNKRTLYLPLEYDILPSPRFYLKGTCTGNPCRDAVDCLALEADLVSRTRTDYLWRCELTPCYWNHIGCHYS
jgi:hypothetical protein